MTSQQSSWLILSSSPSSSYSMVRVRPPSAARVVEREVATRAKSDYVTGPHALTAPRSAEVNKTNNDRDVLSRRASRAFFLCLMPSSRPYSTPPHPSLAFFWHRKGLATAAGLDGWTPWDRTLVPNAR